MHSGRILYMNHDNPNPSGGVRVVYDHVRHLRRNGYEAFVVHHNAGFKPVWFQEDVPVLYLDHQFSLQPDDLVIIPEDHAGFLELFRAAPVRKIVFCQNHFYIFEGLHTHESYQALDISGILTCSDVIADFLRSELGMLDVQTVHCAVPPQFSPAACKKMQIAYMPRKRQLEARFIKGLCTRLLGHRHDVEWVAIDGVTSDDVAAILGESAIFLSLSRLEGFGLPPLEAMASGCLVVGFTGFGGEEYACPDNGLWCKEDDLIACAHALADAVLMVASAAPEAGRLVAAARRTAAEYSCQRQEQELLAALHNYLRRDIA